MDAERNYWQSDRLTRRRLVATGAVTTAGSALILAGCSSRSRQSSAPNAGAGGIKRGGTITAFINSPSSEDLDPYGVRSESASTQPLMALVYNGLLRLKLGGGISFTDRT